MVVVALTDGLANRMFQYAFGVGLKYKGYDVLFDNCHYKPKLDQTWEFVNLMDPFPNIDLSYSNKWQFFFTFPYRYRGSKYVIKLFKLLKLETVFIEPSLAFIPNIEASIKARTLLYGHWQTELYFAKCANVIKEMFVFLPFTEEKNIYYSNKMSQEESVAIHIRKGKDYHQWKSTHGICEKDYYLRAVDFIKERTKKPVFYIFTDNSQWVKDNLVEFEYVLVDWNPIKGKYNFRDMQLMSCAKHNIIANSTYSWWGAWLNNNPNKIVIAPKKWVNDYDSSLIENNVVPNEWIKM